MKNLLPTLLKWSVAVVLMITLNLACTKEQPEADNTILPQNYTEYLVKESTIFSIAEQLKFLPESGLEKSNSDNQPVNQTYLKAKEVEEVIPFKDRYSIPAFYVITYKDGGFIVLSADQRTMPIIAYSESDTFSIDDLSPNFGLTYLLDDAKEAITYYRSNSIEPTAVVLQSWDECELMSTVSTMSARSSTYSRTEVCYEEDLGCSSYFYQRGPLLQTMWGQGDGYNNKCPYLSCSYWGGIMNGRAYTGCAATAMAQLVRYHQHPSWYTYNIMPNKIETYDMGPGVDQVAQLMYDAGRYLEMSYGCSASGSLRSKVAPALRSFGYSTINQENFNINRIISEINSGRPVYVSSDTHAWICDGYQNSISCVGGLGYGYYFLHMNWGWDGSYQNTWYAPNNLNPGNINYNGTKVIITVKR